MDKNYEIDPNKPLLFLSHSLTLNFYFLPLYFNRDVSVKIFQKLSALQTFKVIEIELGFIYDFLYTKANAIYSRLGIALRIIAIFIISIVLVRFLNLKERHHHSRIDVIITLVLLVVALFMELYAFRELLISDQTAYWLIKNKKAPFIEVINCTL